MTVSVAPWERRLREILAQPGFHPGKSANDNLFSFVWRLLLHSFPFLRDIRIGPVRVSPVFAFVALPILLAFAWMLFRQLKGRHRALSRSADGRHPAAAPTPRDLLVMADQRTARGEFREAARCLFDAALRHLSERGEVTAAPAKTNGDYVQELRRRRSPAQQSFQSLAAACDEIWYKAGPPSEAGLSAQDIGRERLRAMRGVADGILSMEGGAK